MESNKKELKFKTNINCGGCVAAVKPFLDGADAISHWEVDTQNKDKVLTVEAEDMSEEAVMELVKKAGYKIEAM